MLICNYKLILIYFIIFLSFNIPNKLISEPSDCYKIDRQRPEWILDTTTSVSNSYFHNEIHIEIKPNPITSSTTLLVKLQKSQNIKIELFNSIGHFVSSVYQGFLNAGTNNEIIINTTGLSNGLYYCKITGQKFNKFIKILIIK